MFVNTDPALSVAVAVTVSGAVQTIGVSVSVHSTVPVVTSPVLPQG